MKRLVRFITVNNSSSMPFGKSPLRDLKTFLAVSIIALWALSGGNNQKPKT